MKMIKKTNILLQVHIAEEKSKYGFESKEIKDFFSNKLDESYKNINIIGLMGMATFTNNKNVKITYNHDEVLKVMLPKLNILPCWIKRGYWSQSTDMPKNVRDIVLDRVELS